MRKMSLYPFLSNKMDTATFEIVMDELELTQAMLASRLDVDRKTVSRWANGDVPIPGSVALLLTVAMETNRLSHVWQGHDGDSVDTITIRRTR